MPGHAISIQAWNAIERHNDMNKIQRTLVPLIATLLFSNNSQADDLLQIYQLSLDNDPVISGQQYAFEATAEGQREVKSLYYPNISFNADYTTTDSETTASPGSSFTSGDSDIDVTSYDFTLLQPIFRWDYVTQLRQAKATTRQAEADLNQAYQDLILRVAEAYFDVLGARDDLVFAQAEKEAIARQLDQAKQRFEVGLIAITDVHESQAAYDSANAGEIVARNTLLTSRESLRELTGQLPERLALLGGEMELAPPEPADIDAWVDVSLNNNFQIIAAEAGTEAALQVLAQQRAGRYPQFDLFASYGVDDFSGNTPAIASVDREETNTAIGVQLSIPLYQGGGVSAGIRRANSQLSQARDVLESQRRTTQSQASRAYLSVEASVSRVQALKQAVISSESALKATEAGYDVGTRTTVDVLNVRRELFRNQAEHARSRYEYLLAGLILKQAAGSLSIKDVEKINSWLVPPPS